MKTGTFLLAVIAWVIFASLWDNRTGNRQKMLAEMRDEYSKVDVVELIYQTKGQVGITYLAYGFLIGFLFAVLIVRQYGL